ncbi:MAG: transporter associated domain-containing protein [Pseudomonadota bacterium]|uniref:CBS domain-containing protein n=1 Tax=marine metagenome TaxID=408172 RepID=A0A381SPN3_9ZZZZ|nr:magnesium/cobalt efflux protein [Gammaproteobacteria bacterium]MEC8867657.1 transporter associated domain-containing protein [Pseudomonadota bacterium]MEE3184016.1 transporter associated domain-containing protein [Pseudomonadota bacterium]HBP15710.1 magnesium/cobalt efflux protein [Gammaproteobacteria bacterium]HCP49182.1 magnesium/cobalt efflux protein [Gammaproteobacteria bacterium]|tara:strand:- start:2979 stop:3815 length:837 start_codon:yes stop_codon:yes gene_type:complete
MSETDEKRPRWREWLNELFPPEVDAEHLEFQDLLREAAARELLNPDALNIIYGALQVADMRARDIMIPRSQMASVSVEARLEEFLPFVIEQKHSRFPVIGDDLDDVKGILHAKDILPWTLEDDWDDFDIKDIIRTASVVPESKRLNDLLQEFRSTRNHMAVVIDEYGHVSGVVTIEDVLEQIVGDIEDEHDIDDDSFIKELDERSYTVKGITTIEDFNEYFGSHFDAEQFDTIGGIVAKEFGYLPKREEKVIVEGFAFKVLNADSRRIRLLHLTCPRS